VLVNPSLIQGVLDANLSVAISNCRGKKVLHQLGKVRPSGEFRGTGNTLPRSVRVANRLIKEELRPEADWHFACNNRHWAQLHEAWCETRLDVEHSAIVAVFGGLP
jgi:hypothetical protein